MTGYEAMLESTGGGLLWPPFCFWRTIFRAQQHLPSAHELAQRVDRHYDQLQSLKAGFSESYAGLGMTKTESGTLLLRKPGRMMWQYSSPPGKIFLLDGKYAWFYTQGDAQVQRIPAKELDDLRSPLRFLLGHTQLEKEIDRPDAGCSAEWPLYADRPAQRPGKTRNAGCADGDARRHDQRDRSRRGRRRDHAIHVHGRAAERADSSRDFPLHAAGGRAGGGRDAAGVKKQD